MIGSHCLKTWSKTQAIIAKSSAEAELYGVVRGATESLGMCTFMADLGRKVLIRMNIDAAAAKGIIERRGLSKVRHIDVNVLWLQELCARKMIPVHKVPGEQNPADLTTKHLTSILIERNIQRMHMKFQAGRASKAAQLHAVSKQSKRKEFVRSEGYVGIDKARMSIGRHQSHGAGYVKLPTTPEEATAGK